MIIKGICSCSVSRAREINEQQDSIAHRNRTNRNNLKIISVNGERI